jgi:signal transduction histidine kinase
MVASAGKFLVMPFRSKVWIAYGIGMLCLIVATVVRYVLDPVLGDHLSFGFFFLAVSVAAWMGGIWPALFAAVLGCVLANYLFTAPAGSFAIDSAEELLNMLLFMAVSVVIGVLSEISLRSLSRAKAAEKQKDDFLAIIAHELRSPLSVIQYTNQLNRLAPVEHPDERSAIIDRQVTHITHLVEDLLDISRVARGKIHLNLERIDAADIVHGALEQALPLIEERQHVLHLHLPPEPMPLFGDRMRLEQVLTNLLTNAAKYTPAKGEIEVAVVSVDGMVQIRVRDNGLGIPKDKLKQVFEPFAQLEQAVDKSAGGLGIGLSIVRKLVEMHGGTVSAASDGPQRGSEFAVRLPCSQAKTGSTSGTLTSMALNR